MAGLLTTDFADLAGWSSHDHKAALAAFRDSARHFLCHPPKSRKGSAGVADLMQIAAKALELSNDLSSAEARAFFESNFTPMRLEKRGMLTGYYEPVFDGSLTAKGDFSVPLHKRPPDLISLSTEEALKAGFSPETSFARKSSQGLSYHLSRGEVMAGGLAGQALELVWLRNVIDAYIIHIQGSARIRLDDGATMRVTFDGKSGHPYHSLGKTLIEKGIFTPQSITMDALMDYVRALGAEGEALLAENPSYIFFRSVEPVEGQSEEHGPVAAAGIPLLSRRSIAVDRHIHTFGLPIWLETTLPQEKGGNVPFQQLTFAHDTGSAIKGAARADLFVGTGRKAGKLAGQIQQEAAFTCLMPQKASTSREVDHG